MIDYTVVEKQVDTYLSNIINTPQLYYWIYIYPFYKTNLLLCSFFRYIQTFTCSVVHLSSLILDVLWLGILNIIITFSISHWLIHVSLVLSLLHVKWWVITSESIKSISLIGELVCTLVLHGVRIIWYRHYGFDCLVHSFVFGVKDTRDVTLELFLLRLHVFYGERDDCSPNLNGHCMVSL